MRMQVPCLLSAKNDKHEGECKHFNFAVIALFEKNKYYCWIQDEVYTEGIFQDPQNVFTA